jgi:NADH-quinone oxidoreductase subunit C
VPDATGLELLAQDLRDADADSVLDTVFFREQATIIVASSAIRAVLQQLREKGYSFLCSVHGVDYYPEEPRLGVHYELLDMERLDRVRVKLRVHTDAPEVDSVTPDWPTANHQEREVYDMFGVVFDGHPDLRRILMPEDYEGFPQRRDFPIGGEPVLFTKDEFHGRDYTAGVDEHAEAERYP